MEEKKPLFTFWQYITRPSGLGRTWWWAAIVINAATLFMESFSLWADDSTKYVMPLIGTLVMAIFWTGTWKNYKADRYGLPTSPKSHVNDIVGEGTPDPVWKKGNKPILEFERWVAARKEKPYDTINAWLDGLTRAEFDKYIDEFTTYLKRHQ